MAYVDELLVLRDQSAIGAFLSLAAWSEGTSTSALTKNDGYDVIVTHLEKEDGRLVKQEEIFANYAFHPFECGRPAVIINPATGLWSTASGRYQITLRWWLAYKHKLGLSDFSPRSQDLVAIAMLTERRANLAILNGDIVLAIKACSSIWASFPGNDYGQGGKTIAVLEKQWSALSHA